MLLNGATNHVGSLLYLDQKTTVLSEHIVIYLTLPAESVPVVSLSPVRSVSVGAEECSLGFACVHHELRPFVQDGAAGYRSGAGI